MTNIKTLILNSFNFIQPFNHTGKMTLREGPNTTFYLKVNYIYKRWGMYLPPRPQVWNLPSSPFSHTFPSLKFLLKNFPTISFVFSNLFRKTFFTYLPITTSPHLTSKLHLFIMILPPSSLPLFHLNSYLKTYLKSIVRNSYSSHFFPTFASAKKPTT